MVTRCIYGVVGGERKKMDKRNVGFDYEEEGACKINYKGFQCM